MPNRKEDTAHSPYKVPPHNLEAEQAILGSILINNDALNQVVDILSGEDFYREAHACIFEGMLTLYNKDDPVDLITLPQVLRGMDTLERVGGTDYLASLVEGTSTSAGIMYHAEIVKDLSTRRNLINRCSYIAEICFQPSYDTEEILDLAEQSIFEIAERNIDQNFYPLSEVVKKSFKKIETIRSDKITGISTGFTDFDGRADQGIGVDITVLAQAADDTGRVGCIFKGAFDEITHQVAKAHHRFGIREI